MSADSGSVEASGQPQPEALCLVVSDDPGVPEFPDLIGQDFIG